MKITADK